MHPPRASEVVKRRLTLASRRLGTTNPVDAIGGFLDRSFELPLGDPRYGRNALVPGHLPIEHSFSEVAGDALRLDLEPLGPGASPLARAQEASREMRRLVDQAYGRDALRWFDERSEGWRRATSYGPSSRFGAWFGAGFDDSGLQEAKVYYELTPNGLDALPPNLQHAVQVATAMVPGLVPLFTSVACGRHQGSQRVYLYHRGELRLLDLEPLMHKLGIGHQISSLLTAVGLLLGGRFTLPDGGALLGLRDTARGIELKLDLLLPGIPDPPRDLGNLIQMHMALRPESLRHMRTWMQAMTPDEARGPGDISAVSVRVTPQMAARLTVYFLPVGYEAEPTASGGARVAAGDPYALRG